MSYIGDKSEENFVSDKVWPSVQFFFAVKESDYTKSSFPSFREPKEIGTFSLDGERKIQHDNSQLKYLIMPSKISNLRFDLDEGYGKAIQKKVGTQEKLDNLLQWIAHNGKKFSLKQSGTNVKNQGLNTDFICYRGLLTEILCTPYQNKDDWQICATLYKGTIYLCAFETDQKRNSEENKTERERRMCSWGYKFETFMTSGSPCEKPNPSIPVNENTEYCCVVRSRLNSHSLVYGAEVDGIDPLYLKKHPDCLDSTRRYIELKTSREITTERQDLNFCRYKLIKWWAQSFLIGISKIICGFRNDAGIAHSLRIFPVQDIPKMAETLWSASVCMNFCDQFLSFVKQCVTKDDPRVVYKFYWRPRQDITCTELSPASLSGYQILPEWYIDAIEKKFSETTITILD